MIVVRQVSGVFSVQRVLAALTLAALTTLGATPADGAAALSIRQSAPLPPQVRTGVLGAEDGNNVGVAVLDTTTGAYYGSLDADTQFPAESVVKILIAANLLATGQMSGAIESMAYEMITRSDDADADDLWGDVGGPNVVGWAMSYFGVSDLGAPPTSSGHWGNTKLSARGLVEFLAAVKANAVVGPWLLNAMSHTAPQAADGTDQDFGLPAQDGDDGAFKQGWGGDSDGDSDLEQLNSVGLLDHNRYAVALMVQHESSAPFSDLVPVITDLAAAVAPDGLVVPVPTSASPPSTTPSATPMPTTTASTSAARATAARRPTETASAAGADSSVAESRVPQRFPVAVTAALALTLAIGAVIVGLRSRRRRPDRR